MLAKVWKKVLLAICIVACIYNVMSKLVNRHSLEENLESANDGVLVFDVFTDNEQPSTSEAIKDALNQMELTNQIVEDTVVEEGTIIEDSANSEVTNEGNNDETESSKSKKGFSFSDFTIKF